MDLLKLFRQYPLISTDTRSILPGSIYFALKGERFDGNVFVEDALRQGAAYAVSDRRDLSGHSRVVVVEDTLTALQDLAAAYRATFDVPVIGLTGSNGKTTTKELLVSVLGRQYKVHATRGNLNNHIGVPLTLLEMPADTEIAVIEMGANHPGEIALLSKIADPRIGIITSIGKAHLEGFGSLEGVARSKSELFAHIGAYEEGCIIYQEGYELLAPYVKGGGVRLPVSSHAFQWRGVQHKIVVERVFPDILFGWHSGNMLSPLQVGSDLFGMYNLQNIELAMAAGIYLGMTPEQVAGGISAYVPSNNRSQQIDWRGNRVILDAYNANPSSMQAALEVFAALPGDRKVLVLGSMKELGDHSLAEHARILDWIDRHEWSGVMLVGDEMCAADTSGHYQHYSDAAALARALEADPPADAVILVKGSRSNKLESAFVTPGGQTSI